MFKIILLVFVLTMILAIIQAPTFSLSFIFDSLAAFSPMWLAVLIIYFWFLLHRAFKKTSRHKAEKQGS